MKIYITDKNEVREIKLFTWDGSNYSPDIFADFADDLPRDFPSVRMTAGNTTQSVP